MVNHNDKPEKKNRSNNTLYIQFEDYNQIVSDISISFFMTGRGAGIVYYFSKNA